MRGGDSRTISKADLGREPWHGRNASLFHFFVFNSLACKAASRFLKADYVYLSTIPSASQKGSVGKRGKRSVNETLLVTRINVLASRPPSRLFIKHLSTKKVSVASQEMRQVGGAINSRWAMSRCKDKETLLITTNVWSLDRTCGRI